MSVERINPESSTDSAAAREPAVPFRVPLTQEAGFTPSTEKKSKRNRKKRKKELNNAVAAQQAASPAPREKEQPPKGVLTMDSGEFTLWQRPEGPQVKASAKLGEKVVGAVRRDEPESVTEKFKPAEQFELKIEDKKPTETLEEQKPSPLQAPEWHQQPMIQHQAGEQIKQPERPEDENEKAKDATSAVEAEPRPYEPVSPPPQPPDPLSYRRRFWNEAPVAGPVGDRTEGLPPPHTYEYLPQEPAYRPTVQRVEAPAAVPSLAAKRYESDIPPGYQRSQADVNRGAWTGLLAGWWIGRRGKRKAVERARQAGIQEGMQNAKANQPLFERRRRPVAEASSYASPQLEAEPIHSYPSPEAGRTVIQPLSAEARDPLRPPEQRPDTITRVVEQIAVPSVAVAVFERAVSHSVLERRVEASPAIKLAAAKAAEAVVARPLELAVRAGAERQLGKRELMRLSKDIKVDGVPLKEIYKAKKIDEVGLRSVVDTYLRGGDVRQQLAEEIVVKEQSYERDPVLRHQRLVGERKAGGRGRGAGQKVSRALGAAAASTGSTARSAGRAIASGAKTAQRDIIDNSNTTDWLSITAVVVLYSVILLLLLT